MGYSYCSTCGEKTKNRSRGYKTGNAYLDYAKYCVICGNAK